MLKRVYRDFFSALGFTKVFTDSAGNLWIQTGDGEFVIYNPDGIVGLTALKGKLTKNELPKEED